ncbi:hypothetical protein NL676_035245 [Syzygium grande]|nr:hypothetical protein NL676_035245 [Syzygium grande]
MAFRTHQEHMPGLLELACGFFKPVMRMEKLPESEVKHFVDMIRLSFLPSVRKVPNESNKEIKFNPECDGAGGGRSEAEKR